MSRHAKRIRAASLFVIAGLVVQLLTTLFWGPLQFVLFTVLGVPLVLVGTLLYVLTVLKILKERQAL